MNASKKTMSDSTLLFLPQEILVEILTKLPVKSLLQFRCVSKSFCSLIGDPRFADLHRTWSLTLPSRMSILISFRPHTRRRRRGTPRVHYKINYSNQVFLAGAVGPSALLQANRVRYLDGELFRKGRLGPSVNGLISICMDNGDVTICNLSTRQHVSLPRTCLQLPNFMYWDSVLLGFDPVSKRYKVLKSAMCGYDGNGNGKTARHWIFTLGVDKSWREINCCCFCPYGRLMSVFYSPLMSVFSHASVHIDGVIYSLNSFSCGYDIGAFDVGAENFRMICFPDELSARYHHPEFSYDSKSALVDLDGQLAFIHLSKEGLSYKSYKMEIWTWKKAKEWEKSTTLIPLEESQIINQPAISLRFTSNHVGEIVLLIIKGKCVSILFYNFRRQVWRKFDICGIRDDLIKGFPSEYFIHISVDNLFSLE